MNSQNTIVILGKFDGVHIGHQKLISRAREIASETKEDIVVYAIGTPGNNIITKNDEKEQMLKSFGINRVIFKHLDETLRNMKPKDFVESVLLCELRASKVIVGENFRFGKDRCADSAELKRICADVGIVAEVIDTVCTTSVDGFSEAVSSTAVRKYISEGYVQYAAKHLGRWYTLKGKVVEGKHLGRKLGFPTINVMPDQDVLLPKCGVYATRVKVQGFTYDAITNVGTNPTVEDQNTIKIESHLFNAHLDCYGSVAEISFVGFVREEKRFESIDALKKQMRNDKENAILLIEQGVQ